MGSGRTLSAPWSLGLDQAELHIALALDESSIQGGFSWCLSRYSVTGGEKSLYWGNMWKPCRLLSALGGRRGQRSRGEAASGLHLRASGRVPPAFSLLRSQALTLASHVNSSSSHLYSFSKKVTFAEQFSQSIGSSYRDFFRLCLGGFCCSEAAPSGCFFPSLG